ncbi:MAG TPA: helicase C-terminal domain-containing protein, partial [Albitalea sp.]|nr:helicase C-terminal domain-containing protein [Albitalea sp.]
TNDRNGCVGRKCSSYASCPYYATRKTMEQANVFVANHDLVLADLQSGNVLLPKPEHTVAIFDEAHHLATKALHSLANGHALEDARTWVMRAGKLVAAVRKADRNGPLGRKAAEVMAAMEAMAGALSEAQMVIGQHGQTTEVRDEKRPVRFAGGDLPAWLETVAADCRSAAEYAKAQVTQLMELLQGEEADVLPPKQREKFASDVGAAVGRIECIVAVWRLMTERHCGGEPVAKWIELSGGEERDIRVCASPIGVGEYLHEALWSKVAASIHTSATLTTVGGFDMHLQDTGLGRVPGVRTLEVASPFDYAAQASLVVPRNVRNPKDVRGHTEDLIALITDGMTRLGEGKGALCLFSSWKQLEAVAAGVPDWIAERVLKQGTVSKRELIRQHTEAVRAGRASILFGTASLEEGVDLRGDLCALVVVAKLQFAVPTDPVSEARREHFETTQRDYFQEVEVPEACRRLAQSAGRLLRSETDRGSIIVADPRLAGTEYGRRMIAALPPYRLDRSPMPPR